MPNKFRDNGEELDLMLDDVYEQIGRIDQMLDVLAGSVDGLVLDMGRAEENIQQLAKNDEDFLAMIDQISDGQLEVVLDDGEEEEPVEDEPLPPPVTSPNEVPQWTQHVTPVEPSYALPQYTSTVSGLVDTLVPESNTRYVFASGSHARFVRLNRNVENVEFVGQGTDHSAIGAILHWDDDNNPDTAPRRLTFESMRCHNMQLDDCDDVFIHKCFLQGDGVYALFASGYRRRQDALSRWEIRDCEATSDGDSGTIRLMDVQDLLIYNLTSVSETHRSLRVHGYTNRALIMDSDFDHGGVYITPHVGDSGQASNIQMANCDVRGSLQVAGQGTQPDGGVDASTIWLTEVRLYEGLRFYDWGNINVAESVLRVGETGERL